LRDCQYEQTGRLPEFLGVSLKERVVLFVERELATTKVKNYDEDMSNVCCSSLPFVDVRLAPRLLGSGVCETMGLRSETFP
jgi:hypothetical protein